MRVNMQYNTISYKSANPVSVYGKQVKNGKQAKNETSAPEINNGHVSLRRMISEANKQKNGAGANNAGVYGGAYSTGAYNSGENSILSNALNYSKQLKAQRENIKDTSLEKKRLKYKFKDISSQIIRSKTSVSARKAVSSARRELMRLKQEKRSGKYDSEEIEAAIAHAKSMERVARKKVKHLEEEEMLKAAGGPCADALVEQEEKLEEKLEGKLDGGDETVSEEEIYEQGYAYAEDEYMPYSDVDFEEMLSEISPEDMEALLTRMEDLSEEMMDEMEEEMQAMLEEMGLDELADSLAAAKGDMDPADLKMMKIKHRCKEMKEIVKADAEYLKTMFEHYEKMKGTGGGVPATASPSVASVSSSPTVQIAMPSINATSSSVIDISL